MRWFFWVVAVGTVLAILSRRYEYDVWKVHHAGCVERYGANKALLATPMCDRGKNELAFRDKVKCSEARKENDWGLWVCTVSSRMSTNTIADALAYARDSWYVFIFLIIVVVVAIRSHWQSRAEIAKHEQSMKTLEKLAPQLGHIQQQQQQQQQQLYPPPRAHPYLAHRGAPSLQGYQRDQYGRLVHVDNRPQMFAIGSH